MSIPLDKIESIIPNEQSNQKILPSNLPALFSSSTHGWNHVGVCVLLKGLVVMKGKDGGQDEELYPSTVTKRQVHFFFFCLISMKRESHEGFSMIQLGNRLPVYTQQCMLNGVSVCRIL